MTLMVWRRGQTRQGEARRHRGQAMVEMALVMLLLLILTFGIADMGLYMYKELQAVNCVREVARAAVVRRDLAAGSYCVDSGLFASVTLSDSGYTCLEGGEPLSASINQTHRWIAIGYLIPALGPTVPLRAAETMRMEGQIDPSC